MTINDLRRAGRRNPLTINDLWNLVVEPSQWRKLGNPVPTLDLRTHETHKGETIGVGGIGFSYGLDITDSPVTHGNLNLNCIFNL